MPAPKGNKNALKHGLYAGRQAALTTIDDPTLRKPMFAIQYMETTIDLIYARLLEASDEAAFTRLAGALSMATTALYNGHRTLAYLTGGFTPVEEALKELQELDFAED